MHYSAVKRPALLALAVASGATIVLASSAPAEAQSKDFSTVRFYPAVGPSNFITVEGANVANHLSKSFGAFFDYAADTLVIDRPCSGVLNPVRCENKKTAFVAGTGMFHLMASISLAERTQLSIDVPLGFTDSERFFTRVQVADGSSPSREFAPGQGFTFADTRVAAKTRILGDASSAFALSGTAFTTLPTAMITSNGDCREDGNCFFTGERGANVGANAVGEYRVANFRVAANLGAAYRPNRKLLTRETGSELLYGVAGQYDITPLVHGTAELTGWVNLIGVDDHPIEARGALSYGQDLVIKLGAGAGLFGEVGNPSYRVFAGAQWTPVSRDNDRDGIEDEDDACPSEPEDRDGHMDDDGCPEPDNDGDGLPDKVDACDDEREDIDGFADEDGCPELDNDGDGVQDGYDSCEGLKEDKDGDRDDDGCPDFDTDRDGIRDDLDRCPNEAEDTDGLADEDGCPEGDFDGDSLKDTDDGCPDQPESWNGILDQDGCPEDDADGDTVPDQVDACAEQAETLNSVKDGDGCADGQSIVTLQGQKLIPVAPATFEGERLTTERPLLNTLADFIKRNHRRGGLRVVLIAPEKTPWAAARAELLANSLEKRTQGKVLSTHVVGSPVRFEIELLPPAWEEPPPPPPPPVVPVAPAPAEPGQESGAVPSAPEPEATPASPAKPTQAKPAAPAAKPATPAAKPATPAAKPATPTGSAAPAAPATLAAPDAPKPIAVPAAPKPAPPASVPAPKPPAPTVAPTPKPPAPTAAPVPRPPAAAQ